VNQRPPEIIVAIVGGATAGAETAGILADRGATAVVFEQNARPYGKIEDGLPRWHVKLRRKEYDIINEKLGRPDVLFVPRTKIGRDIAFPTLVNEWGFSAVVLAHGAWRDRPLPIEGANLYIGRGLLYQNAFISWFNHYTEKSYAGPQYRVVDGAIVVGGGLASIDVLKVLQVETVREELARRGIVEDMLAIEHDGIPAVLACHGLTWQSLGLKGATLFYRRRIEDMPLAQSREGADAARQQKLEATRRRIVEKAMQKYCFSVRPQRAPIGLIVEQERLVGLRFQHTRVEGGRGVPIDGEAEDVRAPLVVSSIGSVPEPMAGVDQDGALYRYVDPDLGRLEGYDTVFSTGNVVTGKGNIAASRKHGVFVSTHLVEKFLGLDGGDHDGEEAFFQATSANAEHAARRIADWSAGRRRLTPPQAEAVLARVRARQQVVEYDCSYREWITRVTPPDLG